jgi:hypothetical protein
MDVDKISNNDEVYMEKYADAIKKSRIAADKNVTRAATSNDPFSGIIKHQLKKGGGKATAMNTYRILNSYMSKFSINEFATSRQAIAGMVGQGEMGAIKGATTMIGVMARMTSYMVFRTYLVGLLYSLTGLGDDEEDYEAYTKKQGVSAGVSLITRGASGNVPMYLVNYGIEIANENYGHDLGLRKEKKYDSHKDGIVYNVWNTENVDRNAYKAAAGVAAGPLGPQLKTADYIGKNIYKALTSDNEEKQDEAIDNLLSARTALEMLNSVGYGFFYKDIRAYILTKDYRDKEKKESSSGPSLSTLKLYDKNAYDAIKKQQKAYEKENKNSKEYKQYMKEMKEYKKNN